MVQLQRLLPLLLLVHLRCRIRSLLQVLPRVLLLSGIWWDHQRGLLMPAHALLQAQLMPQHQALLCVNQRELLVSLLAVRLRQLCLLMMMLQLVLQQRGRGRGMLGCRGLQGGRGLRVGLQPKVSPHQVNHGRQLLAGRRLWAAGRVHRAALRPYQLDICRAGAGAGAQA